MTLWTSVRDAGLVARFEVLRAIRTWRAMALAVLYVVATAGGAYLFVQLIHSLESALAVQLGVPVTDQAGAMLDRLLEGDELREILGEMLGDQALVDDVLRYPVLAIFHLWEGLILIPFFAASISAESISIDMGSRALRFEALRTGRLELVTGRFLGQAALTAIASVLGIAGTWTIGILFLTGTEPLGLATALFWLTLRAWAFALPFVGLGVAFSQWTTSPNWARVMAVGATAGTWVAYGMAHAWIDTRWGLLCDVTLQVLPQGWMQGLWHPAPGWLVSSGVCIALGFALVAAGYLRFARRDL
ncbi:MAG: hypothetical protein JRI25_25985 [Deltaproteobacteria bacterium]|nr:hypothetical protein [Deltaproteobacteria bacterium]MBW2258031.1 hypothetical protein [Deltaproteobacteria bacterium]